MFLSALSLAIALASSVNHPPVITVQEDTPPVVREYGRSVELPFSVHDDDDDSITVHYKFDDAADWSVAPASNPPNVFPGELFADLDPIADHTMQVKAFDGHEESRPVTLVFLDALKRAASTVMSVASKPLQSEQFSPNDLAKSGLTAVLGSFRGDSVDVSYKVDDADGWSTPASYPLGLQTIFEFGDVTEPWLQPGPHKISFRFHDDTGWVTEDAFQYTVNAAPVVELTDAEPLSFKGAPTSAVVLPISVSDADDDQVTVFYRFSGDDLWSHVPTADGVHVLPASVFSDRLGNGKGSIEVFGWDGVDKSGSPLKIEYSVEQGGDGQPEDDEVPFAEEEAAEEELPTALYVGIAVAGVAVIALAVGIVLLVRRNRAEAAIV